MIHTTRGSSMLLRFLNAALTLSAFTACSVVGPGERGIRVTYGAVSDQVKEPGIYLWIPGMTDVRKVNVQIQKSDISSTAATKDMQDVHAHVAVNWSMDI